jgi:chloramphenicol O-acetyltransferase type A
MFLAYLFVSLKAANEIEAFRYRLRGKRVLIHDTIHAGSTVLNQDETFSFCYFSYFGLFAEFYRNAQYVLEQHYAQKAHLEPRDNQDNMIHYSILPWFRFSSISHPRRFHTEDSVPKIVFGKFHEQDNRWFLPISISAHHSLVDGIHVGKYLELIQLLINKSGSILLL